jgi:SPP1 gp7 family putative phage head morphogenesis protein
VRYDPNDWVSIARRQTGGALRNSELEEYVGINEAALRVFIAQQVEHIASIPTEAFKAVHDIIIQKGSISPQEVQEKLAALPNMIESRAKLIARTETSRTMSALTQIQSEALGSGRYIWRTMRDKDVRHAHRLMEGVQCYWDEPPTLVDGTTGHPGRFPNCRCWAEPDFSVFGESFNYKKAKRKLQAS